MAYTILTACQLVSRFVDRGSMAFLLSTPVTRRKVINAQAAVLVTGLVVLCLFTYLGGYFGVLSFVNNGAFDLGVFTESNSPADISFHWILFFLVLLYIR
ncbi:ABC transporter permease subunit [Paenibacillus sp. 22594]|uniref:ABC transporter permease subunit n=1 Tax=Paenibacillus sp. 22594 TaxID=3453947 RepID=UPI003F849340